ncbi:MAG: hypothetical protein QM660_15335 [Dysgonomonas sp.]
MKRILLLISLLFTISIVTQAQKLLEEVKLSTNQQTILILDNNTWKYKKKSLNKSDDKNKDQKMLEEIRLSDQQIIVIFNDYIWRYKLENKFRTGDEEDILVDSDSIKEKPVEPEKVEKPKKEVFLCKARTKNGYCKTKVPRKGLRCWKHER